MILSPTTEPASHRSRLFDPLRKRSCRGMRIVNNIRRARKTARKTITSNLNRRLRTNHARWRGWGSAARRTPTPLPDYGDLVTANNHSPGCSIGRSEPLTTSSAGETMVCSWRTISEPALCTPLARGAGRANPKMIETITKNDDGIQNQGES